ncbi:hypothetical protein C5B85_05200 [Pseudoclavibacter sp. AY1F1]|uniref:FHA domain-containing protein n=1 Tax=Pseudoclavibacter sp. AY1F1 TaxID=2080583 RepID=UPI000CE86B0F|nr:FHA domain-containing protein [Pseudoclavibacter sp. AY1F1]PPF46049.1 hypothetical protein C5B85_05200 [Pseudoclavibacter sp. AY1F1]
MTEALREVEAAGPVIFRQRRHALLIFRQLESSQLADPALDEDCDADRALGAARLAFAEGTLSHDRVFAALLGGGPLSEVASFVYLIAEGNGLRAFARGPLRIVELVNAPQIGLRAAVIHAGDALTWVEALLPAARGVEVTVNDGRRGLQDVPIQLLFAEHDEEISETLAPILETSASASASATTADPDLDGAMGPGEAVHEDSPPDEPTTSQAQAADASDGIAEATIVELPLEDDEAFQREQDSKSASASALASATEPQSDDESGSESGSESETESGGDPEADGKLNRSAHTFPVPILEPDAQADLIGEHDGRTILSDEASRIRQAASARRAARQQSDELGEHDGFTVAAGSLRDLRGGATNQAGLGELGETVLAQALSFETHPEVGVATQAAPAAPPASTTPTAPPVAPVSSAAAESSSAHSSPMPVASTPHQRPALGEAAYIVELSTGGTVELAGPLVLGRAPNMGSEQTGGVEPRHVKLSGATDISRNHVLLSVEGGVIVVTDLHSRNGTDVVMPGRGPQRLRAGEPTAVMPGTVIDLGSGIFLSVRNLSMTARH